MNKHTRRTPARKNLLPFEEWVQKRYPDKKLLRMIGALDLLYLLYRAGLLEEKREEEPSHEIVPIRRAIRKTAAVKTVEEQAEAVKPRRTRKPARRAGSKKKTTQLTLEFKDDNTQPLPETADDTEANEPEPVSAPEPEPLVLEQSAPEAAATKNGTAWLGEESLEDADPLKTDLALCVGGITVAFDKRDIDDEREALLVIQDVPYRVSLVSPSINLGRMLQRARITYGELYMLGRAALGALSGEGYVSADEAERIVRALHAAGSTVTDLDVAYSAKDAKTRNRDTSTIRVRFEPL